MLLLIATVSALAGPLPMFGHGGAPPSPAERVDEMSPYSGAPGRRYFAVVTLPPPAPPPAVRCEDKPPPEPTAWQLKSAIEPGAYVSIDSLPVGGTAIVWDEESGQSE